MYNYVFGLPTKHAGSWLPIQEDPEFVQCKRESCRALPRKWRNMALAGEAWENMRTLECDQCKAERERRNRLVHEDDARLKAEPYLSAPYIHQNNEPKYHAMLLRAV